jgi:hypothetical protein
MICLRNFVQTKQPYPVGILHGRCGTVMPKLQISFCYGKPKRFQFNLFLQDGRILPTYRQRIIHVLVHKITQTWTLSSMVVSAEQILVVVHKATRILGF